MTTKNNMIDFLDLLREELNTLLSTDSISEEQKIARMKIAEEILMGDGAGLKGNCAEVSNG